MNRIKSAASSTLKFADRHKTAITIIAVGTTTTVLMKMLNSAGEKTAVNYITETGQTAAFENYLSED